LIVARYLYPDFAVRRQVLFTEPHAFLISWYLGPMILLLAISLSSQAKLFVPRYYLWGIPGLAILAASALSALHPLPARRVVGLAILLAFCVQRIPSGDAAHRGEDCRGALQAASVAVQGSDRTSLLRSGFPEMPSHDIGKDATIEEPLMVPLAMYPVPGKTVLIPLRLEEADRLRLERIVSGLLSRRSGFVFMCPKDGQPADMWLLGRLSAEAYNVSSLGDFEGITAIAFEPRTIPTDHISER
jgi:hypothetical protein